MKNSRKLACTALLIVLCLFATLVVLASRPSRSEVFRGMASNALMTLGNVIDYLTPEAKLAMADTRLGVKLVDGKMLQYLLEHDAGAAKNEVYDKIMKLELGEPPCRFYYVFNFDAKDRVHSFCLIDTTYGYICNDELKPEEIGPRERFKKVCNLFGVDKEYEMYSCEFLEETPGQKSLKTAKAKNFWPLELFARYWWVFMLLVFFDFFYSDLKLMKDARTPIKMYALGLQLVCGVLCLAYATVFYTNTPVPDMRDFGRLVKGSYPQELSIVSDIILIASFAWWPISIVAVFLVSRCNWSPLIPLLYVIGGPLTFAMSESPFGGSEKLALPIFGNVIMLINTVYIKIKYAK